MSASEAYSAKSRIDSGAGSSATLGVVARERDALLRAKQTELDQLSSRHDDLVRSTFAFSYCTELIYMDRSGRSFISTAL